MAGNSGDEQAILPFDDGSAGWVIRKEWHDGRWFFSVIDVIAVLTDSDAPRQYWYDMKKRIQDEGFREALASCRLLKVPASDGKLYKTDCADFATVLSLLFSVPAWQRRRYQRRQLSDSQGACNSGISGIYAITNIQTQERYIGSSSDIPARINQHLADLRRGKHHAKCLQEAWNRFGADAFRFEVLEEVSDGQLLASIEQQYLDEEQPIYNSSRTTQNNSALPSISTERMQSVLLHLFEVSGFGRSSPVFCVIRNAILVGALRPGPNFSLILGAENSDVKTCEELSAFMQTS